MIEVAQPQSVEQWLAFEGKEVSVRMNGRWVNNCRLESVSVNHAYIRLPQHKDLTGVDLADLHVPRKSLGQPRHTTEPEELVPEPSLRSPCPSQKAPMPATKPAKAANNDTDYVVYSPQFGAFLGGAKGFRSFKFSLDEASTYGNKATATSARFYLGKTVKGMKNVDVRYLTVADARKLVAESERIRREPPAQSTNGYANGHGSQHVHAPVISTTAEGMSAEVALQVYIEARRNALTAETMWLEEQKKVATARCELDIARARSAK